MWVMIKLRGKIHRDAWENAVPSNIIWDGFEDTRNTWSNEPGWGTWNSYPLLNDNGFKRDLAIVINGRRAFPLPVEMVRAVGEW